MYTNGDEEEDINPAVDTPMTELPNGSSCFTATMMSKDEAMKLPLKERPLNMRISSEIYHAVFEAVGAASLCWKPRPKKQVFSTEEAEKVAVDLCFKIANSIEDSHAKKSTSQIGGDHYKSLPIQPVDYCQRNGLGFIEGSVVKYVTRHKAKNGRQDIEKAIHFLQLLLEIEYSNEK